MILTLTLVLGLLVPTPPEAKLLAGRMYWERGEDGWGLYQGGVGGKTPNDFQMGWLSDDGKYWRLYTEWVENKADGKWLREERWKRDMVPLEPPNGWDGTVALFEPGGLILKTINGNYNLRLKDNSVAEIKKFSQQFRTKQVKIRGGVSIAVKEDGTKYTIWVKSIEEKK